MTFRYILTDHEGKIVFSSLEEDETIKTDEIRKASTLINCNRNRAGRLKRENVGEVIAITSKSDLVASSRQFKLCLEHILDSMEYLKASVEKQKEINQKNMQRLIHNLTTLNAHNIQEIYVVISQDELSNKKQNPRDYIISTIKKSPEDTALALLKIAKNNTAIKTEITVFKNLMNSNPKLSPAQHGVHKVIMNILYLFFPDFTDKNIIIDLMPSQLDAFFDYASLHVALYHLLDNTTKYACPNQKIQSRIEKKNDFVSISFEMISLKIADEEVNSILTEGVSGKFTKALSKAGEGIGMGLIYSIIKLNNGRFFFERKTNTETTIMGVPHQCNVFTIELPATGKKPV